MELSFLHGLYDTSGPWASVYFDASHYTEAGRRAIKLRWRDLSDSLHDQGIDEPTLQALDAEVLEQGTYPALAGNDSEQSPHSGPHGLALFAAQGSVRYASRLSAPPNRDSAELGPLPHPTPLLIQRDEQIPWIRVIVNRVGADVQKAGGVSGVRDAFRANVKVEGGQHDNLRKLHSGGWSQEIWQRAAENTWQHNAKEVAQQVDRMATETGAEVIIAAGDIRARQLFIDELPERWQGRVISAENHLDEVTSYALADLVAKRKAAIVDRLRTGAGENAAYGLRATATAFDRRQVDTLLLDPDGIEQPGAEDDLIRAAATTDADLVLVSSDAVRLDDGVGAILRYSDPATIRS